MPSATKQNATVPSSSSLSSSSLPLPLPVAVSEKNRSNSICDSILDVIGDTPMVRLNRVASHLPCEMVVKCEFFNAGGSVKDRIGKRMVLDAEQLGRIQPGDTLIEPTSGNTGIGIALAAAVKGYKCIITLPEKMSKEKVDVLKALGAEIVRTPTEAAWDAPESHISVAKKLMEELPHSHILDQYGNPSNPLAHYEGTAEEIWRQCNGKIDMLVAGAGTGGTISGIAKKLKEYNPNIIIVGVDPEGSLLAQPEKLNDKHKLEPYHVEGIGYDFIPQVLDRTLIDLWIKTNDCESLVMMRKLIRDEGILCGGSSGSAVSGAIVAAQQLGFKAGQRVVVILPDSVRNYMTKALSDDWMIDHGFVDGTVIKAKLYTTWWATKRVCDLPLNTPLTITSDVLCKDAIALLKDEGYDMVPVLKDGAVIGVVTEGNMTNRLLAGRAKPDDSVATAGVIYKTFHKFTIQDTLATLAHALDHDPYALIVTEQRCFSSTAAKRRKVVSSSSSSSNDYFGGGGSSGSITAMGSDDNTSVATVDTDTTVTMMGSSSSSSSRKGGTTASNVATRCVVSGIVTRIDLLDFVSRGEH